MADARHLENRLSAVATPYCPRNAKFRGMKQTRTQVQVTDQIANYENSRWRMFAILKMVYCYISTAFIRFWWNLVCWCEFWFREWSLDKNLKYFESTVADGGNLWNRFWLQMCRAVCQR